MAVLFTRTSPGNIAGRLALASLIAMMTTILNGLADPTFHEPNVFQMFWLLLALGVALPQLPPGTLDFLMAPSRRSLSLMPAPTLAARGAVAGDAGRNRDRGDPRQRPNHTHVKG